MRRIVLLALLTSSLPMAATPPALLNYQGVLRNAADAPLTGNYDMTFTFFDTASGGTELLLDAHRAADGNAVSVSGGLFNTLLGGGVITDGSGAGTYTNLSQVFRDYQTVFLQVKVGAETLTPRTRIVSSAYAQNAQTAQDSNALGGLGPAQYVNTTGSYQAISGRLDLGTTTLQDMALFVENGSPDYAGFFTNGSSGTTAKLAGAAISGGYAAEFTTPGNQTAVRIRSATGTALRVDSSSTDYYASSISSLGYGLFASVAPPTGVGVGGYFENTTAASNVHLAGNEWTIDAIAPTSGSAAQFRGGGLTAGEGRALLAWAGTAVAGYGRYPDYPGFFRDYMSGSWASISRNGTKLGGTGYVGFVQNDPTDASKVIVYAAPEGDEVAVYTRGSARLINGESRVALGPTFQKVANPDLGITAYVTPTGNWADLYVVSKSTEELVVRSRDRNAIDSTFDYQVWALRIGFEDKAIVQPKENESKIPSSVIDLAMYAADPDLRDFSPRSRFVAEQKRIAPASKAPTFERARLLEQAIGVYDMDRDLATIRPPVRLALGGLAPSQGEPATVGVSSDVKMHEGTPSVGNSAPWNSPANDVAAPPASQWTSVDQAVAAGQLLAITSSGKLSLSAIANDPLVYGIVAGGAGQSFTDRAPIALAGSAAICNVDATAAPIEVGDLLVASDLRGHAMRATGTPRAGTVVAKALEPLVSGTGTIRVLVMSR